MLSGNLLDKLSDLLTRLVPVVELEGDDLQHRHQQLVRDLLCRVISRLLDRNTHVLLLLQQLIYRVFPMPSVSFSGTITTSKRKREERKKSVTPEEFFPEGLGVPHLVVADKVLHKLFLLSILTTQHGRCVHQDLGRQQILATQQSNQQSEVIPKKRKRKEKNRPVVAEIHFEEGGVDEVEQELERIVGETEG